MKKVFIFAFKFVVVVFAIAGFALSAAYIAVSLHWTNTKGIIDEQSNTFWRDVKSVTTASMAQPHNGPEDVFFNKKNYCLLKVIKDSYPGEFARIVNLAIGDNKSLAQKNLDALAIVLNVNTDQVLSTEVNSCNADSSLSNISKENFEILANMVDSKSPFVWANSDEWQFFKTSVLKDKDILAKIQAKTGVNSRILVSQLMAEQMRLFYSDRPWFKEAIAPLKVLGSMTQFSWGIFGIKPETAIRIEDNLKDQKSIFYPGADYEKMLDFQSKNISQERFQKITDSDDHYYSYLYAALYDKEIISQWKKVNIDISDRPEILATLFNIGFDHSKPNADPQVGGAELQIGDSTYSFGRLAFEFYYSGELLDEFPQDLQGVTSTATVPTDFQSVSAVNSNSQWCHNFDKNLGFAESGTDEIVALHTVLQKEGFSYIPDGDSVYADATSLALIQFQTKYGITPSNGYAGTKTREELNKLYGCKDTNMLTSALLPILPKFIKNLFQVNLMGL